MRYLFALVAILVTYGSLYPFRFYEGQGWTGVQSLFMQSWELPRSRADLLGNFALFVPFGYCGMLALRRPRWFGGRLVLVCVYGAVLAVALQVAQVFLPRRVPLLGDALINAAGTLAGCLVTAIPYFRPGRHGGLGTLDRAQTVAWILIGSWLGYRLMPFVPSLDVQSIKDSVKPLFRQPLFKSRMVRDAVAWTAVACLWEHAPLGRFRWRWLPVLMGVVLVGEVLVVTNVVYPHTVAGAAAGWLGWWLIGRRVPGRTWFVAGLVGASQIVHGLYPFAPRDAQAPLILTPFRGFLDGTMIINATVLFEKFFFYGGFLRLLQLAGCRLRYATVAGVIITAGIEYGQTYYAGHTPEVTDPILVVMFATVLYALEYVGRDATTTSSESGPSASDSSPNDAPA